MENFMVAVLGASGYGNDLGKKSTSTDITLYDLKKGEDIVTFIEPTRYPERLAPLFYATSMAKKAILVIDELNSTFGECAVMLQCSDVKAGYLILRNYLTREKVEPLIKGTALERYEFIEDNPSALRARLLNEVSKQNLTVTTTTARAKGTIPIDHSFNVKGAGTVVLGVVVNGIIEKHEVVTVLPGKKTAQIRSIQKHDDEFDSASQGDRVGLALKNIEVENLDRGTVLTADEAIMSTTSLKTRASLVSYWPTPIKSGMILHIGHWMQFIPGRVESAVDEGDWRKPILTLTLDKEIIHFPGDQAVVTYLDGGKLRVAGTIKLPSA
ncbi:MAG: EF-Tu/IF-2/RF-3 family GTPase [Candidatus Bathyarchaeota archaeon]